MAAEVRQAVDKGRAPAPRLLFSAGELRAMRDLQAIAGGKEADHD
jgi:hypothetical protein